jgi:hypothetical protein
MDIDLTKIEKFIKDMKSSKTSKWASRKMIVTVAVICGLIWISKGSLSLDSIILQVTSLAALWLVCTTVTDVFEKKYQTAYKIELTKNFGKNGLTKEEVEIVEKV